MKIQQIFHQSGIDLWKTEKHTAPKSMAEVQPHSVKRAAEITISEEGRQALREKVNELNPEPEEAEYHVLTAKDTKEIAWEHYAALREFYEPLFQNGDYDVTDLMKALADGYETLYNKMIEEHKNGDRQADYKIAGKSTVTLEDDLEGLDDAYKWCLSNLEGYITCQQTNKAFANPDSAWYFRRHPELAVSSDPNSLKGEGRDQNDYNYFDQDYINKAISIMKQAREQFLTLFGNAGYNKGSMQRIVSSMINGDADFMAKTQNLFSSMK